MTMIYGNADKLQRSHPSSEMDTTKDDFGLYIIWLYEFKYFNYITYESFPFFSSFYKAFKGLYIDTWRNTT